MMGQLQHKAVEKGLQLKLESNQAALPVHCFGHCLNLCLQDVGRQIPTLRDALDIVREIGELIKYSSKRSHLFSQKIAEADSDPVLGFLLFATAEEVSKSLQAKDTGFNQSGISIL